MPTSIQSVAWLGWVYVVVELGVSLWLAAIVLRKKQPSVAVAWLLIIFLNAWVGLVAYGMVGDVRLGRRRLKRRLGVRARLARASESDGGEVVPAAHRDIARLTYRLGGFPAVEGNDGRFPGSTQEVIDGLVADIDGAAEHVHLLFYIFVDDATGRKVGDALKRAVARGVACRVIADGAGSKKMLRGRFARELRQAGVQLVAAMPVSMLRAVFSRIDLRNHRKIAVIDGRIAYTGSQNIVDANYGGKGGVGAWRDLMVRLEGPVVAQLQHVFAEDWCCETGEQLVDDSLYPPTRTDGPAAIQTLPSGPSYSDETFRDIVVALIAESEERVIITSPYLIPDDQFSLALRIAVLRGVDTHVIVPKKPDQRLVGAAGRSHVQDLLEAGVHVHQHTDGLLHAKTMTVDDTVALMGTANFDIRSFAINFEVSLLGYGPELTNLLRARQMEFMERSERVTLEQWKKRSAFEQFRDNVARLFSPLL